jgi:hypothetical protein
LAVAALLATPPAPIGAGFGARLALAPAPGGVNVTTPPSTGSPVSMAVTVAVSGLAKARPGPALW